MSKRMHRLTLHDTSHLCRKNCIARVRYPLFDQVFTKRRSGEMKRRKNLAERRSVKFFRRFVILFEGKGEIIRKW